MALSIRKDIYERIIKKEPEQEFYDCWKRIASEIKESETSGDERCNGNDDLWDEWNDFNR